MMIVDLIDEVDFKEKLITLGAPVTQEQSLLEVQTTVLSWLQTYPEQTPFVKELCTEMQKDNATVLPEVSSVMAVFS